MSTVAITVTETVRYQMEVDRDTFDRMDVSQLDELVADKIASNDYAELDVTEREIYAAGEVDGIVQNITPYY